MLLQPVTRRIAEDVLAGGPITLTFETGALHDRIPQAMGVAIRDIDSGAAAGPPDREGCVEIGYSLAPSTRGKGMGTAAVAAFVQRLAAVPGIRRLTAVTGVRNTASRRLLERQGFHLTGPVPGTDEVRYTLSLS